MTETFGDVERRLVEQVERSVAREADAPDRGGGGRVQLRRSARRARKRRAGCPRELDRAIETFSRQAERLLAERLAEIGQSGGGQIERRLQNVIAGLERRQEEFVTQLERRMAELGEPGSPAHGEPRRCSGRHQDD